MYFRPGLNFGILIARQKIYYLAFVFLVLNVFFTGCSDSGPVGAIRFALSSGPSNLDPRFATDASSERINQLLYSRLVEFDEKLLPKPSLAEWQLIDKRTYRFHLIADRPVFSNGEKVTARDVVASYRYVLDAANLSPHREAVSMISDIKIIDDETLDFILTAPDPLFPAYLHIAVLPEKLIESQHDFNTAPLGSGPFELVEKVSEQKLVLRRRADGQLIEILQVKDPTVRVLKLLNQEVDLLQNDLSPEMAHYLGQQPGIHSTAREGSNFTYIGFNLADPLTGNLEIRKAISHAIDRDAIIHFAFNRTAVTAEAILPPLHWAGHPALQKIPYDPQRAKRILAGQGYDEVNRLKLVYKTSTDPFRIRLATIIQSQLAEVGIDTEIKSYDWGTFFGDIKAGNFQMYSLSWVGINTPDIFKYVFHSKSLPPNGANRGRYHSRQVDQLLEQVLTMDTYQQQAEIYRKIQTILHKDLPYIPLWYEHQQAFLNQHLTGYVLSADGNYESLNSIRYSQTH